MVYIIEDDTGVRNAIALSLKTLGIACKDFGSITEFNEYFRNGGTLATPIYFDASVDVLILDYQLGEMLALELLESISHQYDTAKPIKAIIISGWSRAQIENKTGVQFEYHFLYKPFGLADLESTLNALGVKT
jgi:DNA-binding response OmpR family regulator